MIALLFGGFTWLSATANSPTLQRLERLKDNESILLGRARVSGEFNPVARSFDLHRTGPRRRDYSLKLVWVPERQTVLYAGANHGRPHRLNDVWEFDLASMTWSMLFAPDNPRSHSGLGDDPTDVEFRDGLLVTKRGGPAVIGHTWWGITYDPQDRRMLFMNTWLTKQDEAVEQLGGRSEERYKGPPLWAFKPDESQWTAIKTSPPGPRAPFGGLLEYVPELGCSVWHMNNWQMRATWCFHASRNQWENLRANAAGKDFKEQAPAAELVGYHDPDRRLIIAQRERGTFHFDTDTRNWTKVADPGVDSPIAPFAHDSITAFFLDRNSGHGILVDLKAAKLWSYDPDGIRWARLSPDGPPMPKGARMLAYADPARNVIVVIDDTTVWAYRHRRTR